jgi:hypothetical protein
MIVFVLGMHKSGTTLVAETLHHSGIEMGVFDQRLGYDDRNTYERYEALDLNRGLLAAASIRDREGVRRSRLERDIAGYQPNTDTASFVRRRKLATVLAGADVEPFRRLAAELSAAHADWGFKDPRTCLTYDVWRRALPEHHVVGVYRRFDEVLSRFKVGWTSPVRVARLVRSWIVHNEMLVDHLRRRDDYVLLRYDELMGGLDELVRMGAYLGRSVSDRRKADMYRARVDRTDDRPNPPFALPRQVIARVAGIERDLAELRDAAMAAETV